jgi:outer membrane protein assembly factor BamD
MAHRASRQLACFTDRKDYELSLEFRRTTGIAALVLALAALSGCGPKQAVPTLGQADADKYLFDRGTQYLAKKNWINAREYFRRLVDSYPQSPYRPDAKLGIGDSYIGEGRIDSLILGANEFREFLSYFPTNPRTDYAVYRLGLAQFKQMLGAQRDQTATKDAIRELKRFLDGFPDSQYRPEVEKLYRQARDRLSESEFKVGYLYYRIGNPIGALNRFTELLKVDPEYTKRDEVIFYTGETLMKMNALAEALPHYERLMKEFEKSKYRQRAEKRVAEVKRLRDSAGAGSLPSPAPEAALPSSAH